MPYVYLKMQHSVMPFEYFFFFLFFCNFDLNVTKIYDKRDNLDFDIVDSLFWMAMSPGVPHMRYCYLNLLDSPELLQILVSFTAAIKPLLPNVLGRAIIILNFTRRSQNFIADTVPY